MGPVCTEKPLQVAFPPFPIPFAFPWKRRAGRAAPHALARTAPKTLSELSQAELVIASALADAPWLQLHGHFWLHGAEMGLLHFPGHGASRNPGLWVVLAHRSAPQARRDPAPHRPYSRGGKRWGQKPPVPPRALLEAQPSTAQGGTRAPARVERWHQPLRLKKKLKKK